MSALRWLAEKIDKQNIVARENAAYGIAERQHVSNESKARELDGERLQRVTDPFTAMSLKLQAAFGLRREESIKLRPGWADRGDALHLKASWTKGGRERDVPITNERQREVLNEAKALAQGGSLIPAEMSCRDQLNRFKAQTARAGIDRVHGLRHAYAQARYEQLTGWKAPAAGGPSSKDLSPQQKRWIGRPGWPSRVSSGTSASRSRRCTWGVDATLGESPGSLLAPCLGRSQPLQGTPGAGLGKRGTSWGAPAISSSQKLSIHAACRA
jgi:hypothetical protein